MAGGSLVSGLVEHLAHSMPEGVGWHSQGHGVGKRVPQAYGARVEWKPGGWGGN